MAFAAKPRGGLKLFKALLKPPAVRRLRLGVPGAILFITDLHLRAEHPEMADTVISALTQLKPDIILLGGDMSEYDEGLELFLSKLRSAFPERPVLAVPGNNDDPLFDGDRARQKAVYAKYGAEYLLNESKRIDICGKPVEIAGLEDAYTHEPDWTGLFGAEEGVYRILLAHEPLKKNICPDADLMLCGHTHGGQINVLGLTCYLLVRYERQYEYALIAGRKQFGKTCLIVSRGIGYSKYPIRLGADGEVHYIEQI